MKLKCIIFMGCLLVLGSEGHGAENDERKTYEIKHQNGSLHRVTRSHNEICFKSWEEETFHKWHLFEKQVFGGTVTSDGEDGNPQKRSIRATEYATINVPSFFPGCGGKKPNKFLPDCYSHVILGWSGYTCNPESIRLPRSEIDLRTDMSQTVFEVTLENNKYTFDRS